MLYNQIKQDLISEFNFENRFILALDRGKEGENSLRHEHLIFSNTFSIYLTYPGYKAKKDIYNNHKYDYCVNVNKNGLEFAISHSEIILDIINKIVYGNLDPQILQNALGKLAICGYVNNYNLPYTSTPPSEKLKNYFENLHNSVNKSDSYKKRANTYDFSVYELFEIIKIIALQEDINYPRGDGRRLPFRRYFEAIYLAKEIKDYYNYNKTGCGFFSQQSYLIDLIQRTNFKNSLPPPLWNFIDYSVLNYVKI